MIKRATMLEVQGRQKIVFMKRSAETLLEDKTPRDNAYDIVWYKLFTEKRKRKEKEQDRRVFKTAA